MTQTQATQRKPDLPDLFALMDVDPEKDSIASALAKFNEWGCRHMAFHLEKDGKEAMLLICADTEMSRLVKRALKNIEESLDREEADAWQKEEI